MTSTARLLPLVVPGPRTPSRTTRDRLEVLTALIAAPNFDPVFRPDVMHIPRDHPVYGWGCGITDCERTRDAHYDYCKEHSDDWRAVREAGRNITDFLATAQPKKPRAWLIPPPCLICPDVPARSQTQLCYFHAQQWNSHRRHLHKKHQQEAVFEDWLGKARPFVGFGPCRVRSCPYGADHPLQLCHRHRTSYIRDKHPGGARLPRYWSRELAKTGKPVPVSYDDEAAFRRWCDEQDPPHRVNGNLTLLGLRPLIKAEIKWCISHHTVGEEGSIWPISWIQRLIDECRRQDVNSMADLDLDACKLHVRQLAKVTHHYLRLIYFTREDTKDAGFIETEHFGIRFPKARSHIDLTRITQRWLRDMCWDLMAARLLAGHNRSRAAFDFDRRGCNELSAYLEIEAPAGGHDPTLLTESHMINFVADQRQRVRNKLPSLGQRARGKALENGIATPGTMATIFDGARRVLRSGLETGEIERLGLDRRFVLALPFGPKTKGRRRPFSDEVARALALEKNLEALDAMDVEDRGLRDAWEGLIVTGRRCTEVLDVRLECISRVGKVPMFWHDQTKVGNIDEGIRIPERFYQRIEARQAKTIARFVQRKGRPPTPEERLELALFPRKHTNRELLKGCGYTWFHTLFKSWVLTLDIGKAVPHQARHTLATNLLKAGANLSQVKRYLGQVSEAMAEHYTHIANTDPKLNDALYAVWTSGPGSLEPGIVLSGSEPMTREEAEAMLIDLTRKSTPAEGGFCTYQPVVDGDACPWKLNCHSCTEFVMSGADLVYWHRKREQWRMLAEGSTHDETRDYMHKLFEPTARAIDGLERALAAVGLLEEALQLDLRRPQDYFGRVWSSAFRAEELARQAEVDDLELDDEYAIEAPE
ncbi:tyrosine-type recombinase/integrase [Streptomyces sp. MBT58]|uniref:tyrosine-type recombinase/integrase n=1 Tax=Streptomyces sp. MBT58 TaxID=1488389 RepID=UPI0019116CDC|nr:tyrosine-type recombinase/integrase [Streptomyces sp. MBT58]MBK5991732.1 tyrosine-type recombinase/integrase [Streptomyces sp. MBT58]